MKILKVKTLLLFVTVILFASCNSKLDNSVKIPAELQNNKEVVAYIKAMEKTSNKLTNLTNSLIKETGGKDIDNSDDLTAIQMLKLGKLALQMSSVASKMEEYQAQRPSIDSLLTPKQILLLDSVCGIIEANSMKVDTSLLKFSKEEMSAVQEKEITEQNDNNSGVVAEVSTDNQYPQKVMEDNNEEPQTQKSQEFSWWHLLFPIGVLALMIFMGIQVLKKIKRGIKDVGYAIGEAKDKVHEAKESGEIEGKKMTDKEKKDLDALDNLLNK